jgi:hypothetical protein
MVSADIFNTDIYRFIAMFLDERSLCRWTQTCKSLWLADNLLTEEAWRVLCEKRWLRTKNLLRSTGTRSFKTAYHILSFRKLPPKGKYTEKRNRLFGYGCSDGLSVWFYLDHSSDCRPRMKTHQGRPTPIITIRLCIQNIRHDRISIMNNQSAFTLISKEDLFGADQMINHLQCFSYKVIAFNGQEVDQYFMPPSSGTANKSNVAPPIQLLFLESVVISLDVECQEDMENEVDFLTSMAKILVTGNASVSYPTPHERRIKTHCAVYDEDDICDQYIFLPRGLVVLKDSDQSA